MALKTRAITARRKQQIYELTALLAKLTVEGRIPRDEFLKTTKGLIRRFVPNALPELSATQEPTHSLVDSRLTELDAYCHSHGFPNLVIPKPRVSNREYRRRLKLGQELFFRAPSHLVSYDAFMQANGQGDHWTVTDTKERAKIGWEPTATGYWFWTEVATRCPRLGTSRNDLMRKIRLLSLEEYGLVWHMTKTGKSIILDPGGVTWNWLRTSYDGSGALVAHDYDGRVLVFRYGAECLAYAYGREGGRLAEVVKD